MTKNRTPRTVACAFLALCALLFQTGTSFGVFKTPDGCILPTSAEQPFNPPIKEVIQPNPINSYGLVTLSNVPAGYSVTNGSYLGWCLDSFQQIAGGVPYCPIIYSSTDTASLTAAGLPTANLDKVNYILNHKPAGQATEVQLAIWHFIGGGGSSETDLETGNGPFPLPIQAVLDAIIADANANGAGFVPGPGQLTGVVLDLPVSLNGLDPDTGLPFQRFLIEVTCPPSLCVRAAITDPGLGNTPSGHAIQLSGIGDFIFTPTPGAYSTNPNGTAQITGTIESPSVPGGSFAVNISLSGLTMTAPPGSPKLEFFGSSYAPAGPIDPATWKYYTGFGGTLTGNGSLAGAVLNLTPTGPAFQIGVGANGKNGNFGASNWFLYNVVSQPSSGPVLQTSGQGDVNIDIFECLGTKRIGDFVWKDGNNNGIQDDGVNSGINGVFVTLKDSNNVTLAVTTTGANPTPNASNPNLNGYYQFTNLLAGTYYVVVNASNPALGACVPTTVGAGGSTSSNDSNANPATVILLSTTLEDQTIDFGYVNAQPGFQVMKMVNKTTVQPFEPVTYTYTVKNTGGTTLTHIELIDDNATPSFAGDDFIVVTGLTLAPGTQQTFTLTKFPPLALCATIDAVVVPAGTLAVQQLANGDYRVIYRQSLNLVDNTYGTNASPDWGGGHSFGNFTGSDSAEFRFKNGAGATVLDFEIDYISASAAYPSGFGTLGATGGDGSLLAGSLANIVSSTTTMTTNLNQSPAFYGFTVNSPAPPANFPTWDYVDGYTVVVKGSTFGVSGFGSVSVPLTHNSPPKIGRNAVSPVPCESDAKNTAKGTAKSGATILMAQADATVHIVGQTTSPSQAFTTYKRDSNGWDGATAGALLTSRFSTLYPTGLIVGGTKTLTFTSAAAIQAFLPTGGSPKALAASATNPTTSAAGELAGQTIALKLNLDFSNAGFLKAGLGSLKLKSGKFAGKTVTQMLAIANSVLGGGAPPAGTTISDVNAAAKTINENYDKGTTDKGNLIP